MVTGATRRWAVGLAVLLLASGCVRHRIDVARFGVPRTVVIEDIPDARVGALIGNYNTYEPTFHFSAKADYFYTLPSPAEAPAVKDHTSQVASSAATSAPPSAGVAGTVAAGAIAGGVGALIQGMAEDTQKRAMGFHAAVLARYPAFDLRRDLQAALRAALEARGVAVTISPRGRRRAPRLRWPAASPGGEPLETGPDEGLPPEDADLFLQVSPVVFFEAPGPLNDYTRDVSIGVVVYAARTKEFLGMQVFRFNPPGFATPRYSTYDDLVADLDTAGLALREALLTLVPEIVDIVTVRPPK